MAIELVKKYLPYVDELFTQESKKSLLTNNNFSFDGAQSVKMYKINTAEMSDYGRSGPSGNAHNIADVLDIITAHISQLQDL